MIYNVSENSKVTEVHAASAYDSRVNFNEAARIWVETVIKLKINSTGKSKGSYVTAETVREFLSDPELWKKRQ